MLLVLLTEEILHHSSVSQSQDLSLEKLGMEAPQTDTGTAKLGLGFSTAALGIQVRSGRQACGIGSESRDALTGSCWGEKHLTGFKVQLFQRLKIQSWGLQCLFQSNTALVIHVAWQVERHV